MFELVIENLSVKIEKKIILKNINLHLNSGDVASIFGLNGSGKSTLLKTIIGHFSTQIIEGKIYFKDKLINKLNVDERARMGIFLALQEPEEIDGLTNLDFLNAIGQVRESKLDLFNFFQSLQAKIQQLKLPQDTLKRELNVNFSGGEKKKNEILQMLIINPICVLLDEVDAGLDTNTLNFLIETINNWRQQDKIIIVVSHSKKFLELIHPNKTYVMENGVIN